MGSKLSLIALLALANCSTRIEPPKACHKVTNVEISSESFVIHSFSGVPNPLEKRYNISTGNQIFSLYYGIGISGGGKVYYENQALRQIRDLFHNSPALELEAIPMGKRQETAVYDIINFNVNGMRYTRYVE